MKSILTFLLYLLLTVSFAQNQSDKTIIVDDMYGNSEKSLIEVKPPKVDLKLTQKYLATSALSLAGAVLVGVATIKISNKSSDFLSVLVGGAIITTGLFAYTTLNFIKSVDELVKALVRKKKLKKIQKTSVETQ